MTLISRFRANRPLFLVLAVMAFITTLFSLPFAFRTRAAANDVRSTPSHDESLPNYDIRSDRAATSKLAQYRDSAGRNAVEIADARDAFVRGEENLKNRVPTLKVEYNADIRIPEVIGPDVKQGRAFLSAPTRQRRSDVLKSFLRENAELVGARASQIDDLKVAADYRNPDGNLSFVELNQEINGVPVFRGEVKAGFTRAGQIIRVINNLAPGLDGAAISNEFGEPLNAVNAAAGNINLDPAKPSRRRRLRSRSATVVRLKHHGCPNVLQPRYLPDGA